MSLRVGILWRADWDPVDPSEPIAERCRLHGMFSAFAALGVEAEPVVYADDDVDAVRTLLLQLDGVLVWANPIEQGLDRNRLDALLREVAGRGVWVSAHPDVIQKMATKQVLVDTAGMSWSAETHLYASLDQLRAELPGRLARDPLVLKQQRGMGGEGVWKVQLDGGGARARPARRLRQPRRIDRPRRLRRQLRPYFADGGVMVEQPFQPRLDEGMIRVYLSHDRSSASPTSTRGLLDPTCGAPPDGEGLLAASGLAARADGSVSCSGSSARRDSLPVIWDADFVLGGNDDYVLIEINASSTFAFPEHAMPTVARAALARIAAARG